MLLLLSLLVLALLHIWSVALLSFFLLLFVVVVSVVVSVVHHLRHEVVGVFKRGLLAGHHLVSQLRTCHDDVLRRFQTKVDSDIEPKRNMF